jgi:hypothetical protein
MKAATGAALLVLLASAAAPADTIYRYHDMVTGRDVFVNRPELVPKKYRNQAKIVVESGALANQDEVKQNTPQAPADDGLADKLIKELAPAATSDAQAAEGSHTPAGIPIPLLRNMPTVTAAKIDGKLTRAGAKPLADLERAQLARLLTRAVYLGLPAGLCALLVWVVMLVSAFRDKHPVWGALMIVLFPVSYLYLALHFATGRPLIKAASALGLLAPALLGAWLAWQYSGWMQAVVQARGGRI